jgi:ABC-type cobalt transport system substrate-binding protein
MAALLLLLAIAGTAVVADLVLENNGTGAITVLHHPVSGDSEGLLLAIAAAVGLVIGLLVVGSVSLRRTRRVRRKRLRQAEHELRGQLAELKRENIRLCEELAHRDAAARRLARVAVAAADPEAAVAAAQRTPAPVADRQVEPLYEEARRVARLRSSFDLDVPATGVRSGRA